MSKWVVRMFKVFAHLTIAWAISMMVLIGINFVNTAMGFLKGDVFIIYLCSFVVCAIITAIGVIIGVPTSEKID